jgi:hypothetical protein
MKILIIVLEKVQERILTENYTRDLKKEGDADSGIVSGLWCYSGYFGEAHPHIGT